MRKISQSKPGGTLEAVALSIARISGLFGWDNEVASEFCRPIKAKCPESSAIIAIRKLHEEQGKMPSQYDIIARASTRDPSEIIYVCASDGYCYFKDGGLQYGQKCGCKSCHPQSWCHFPGCNKLGAMRLDDIIHGPERAARAYRQPFCSQHLDRMESHLTAKP